MLDAQRGNARDSAPREYTQALFDAYADRFEHELTSTLEYSTPTQMRRLLAAAVPAARHYSNVLDIGCGTGLAGEALHAIAARLWGISVDGHFLCSTELADTGSYTLQSTARIAHSSAYVIECASRVCFEFLAQEAVPLRKERGVWRTGGMYCFARRV